MVDSVQESLNAETVVLVEGADYLYLFVGAQVGQGLI